jgi:hypothetical protein
MYKYFAFILILFSCSKQEKVLSTNASITGIDLTLSACSGGYIVKLDDSSVTYQWEPKLSTSQEDFGIGNIDKYPIKIKMEYDPAFTKCSLFDGYIDITALTIE